MSIKQKKPFQIKINTDFVSKIDTTGITNGQILIYNTARSKFVAGDGYSTGNFNTDFATKSIHDLNDVVAILD